MKNASNFGVSILGVSFLTVFFQKLYRKNLIQTLNDKLENLCPPTFLIVATIQKKTYIIRKHLLLVEFKIHFKDMKILYHWYLERLLLINPHLTKTNVK